MEIKENYTREEADFMSLISATLGESPREFQGDSAHWGILSVDFKEKELGFNVDEEHSELTYYTMAGIATLHGFSFEEYFTALD